MTMATLNGDHLLEVKNLKVAFKTDEGLVRAVEGVDFTARRGKTLGIVGESGSGKSVSTKSIMQLLPQTAVIDSASTITFQRQDGDIVEITELNGHWFHLTAGGLNGGEQCGKCGASKTPGKQHICKNTHINLWNIIGRPQAL